MAEKIDELLVEIGFDVKKALEGVKKLQDGMDKTGKSGEATNKKLESSASGAAKAFGSIRNELVLIGGALATLAGAASLKSFFSNSVDEMSKLKFLSETMGIATERIQEYTTAAEKMGASGGDIINMLSNVAGAVADYKKGIGEFTGQNGPYSVVGLIGGVGAHETLTAEQGIRAYADALRAAYAKSNEIGQQFAQEHGISPSLIPLLKQGGAEFEKFVQSQAKYATVSKKDADAAQELNKQLIDIKKSFEAAGNEIVVSMLPAIKSILKEFQGLGDWFLEHKDTIAKTIGSWATSATEFIKSLIEGDLHVSPTLDKWIDRLESIGKILDVIGGAANLVSSAFTFGETKTYTKNNPDKKLRVESKGSLVDEAIGLGIKTNPTLKKDGKKVIEFFMSKGWTREQSAGIAANLWEESNFNPKANGDSGKAYGIAQWHKDRADKFKQVFGRDLYGSSLEQQLAFVDWELKNTESKAGYLLKGATSAKNAGAIVSSQYERPAARIKEMMERGGLARKLFYETYDNVSGMQASKAKPMQQAGSTTAPINVNGPVTVVANDPKQFADKLPSKVVPQMARAQR